MDMFSWGVISIGAGRNMASISFTRPCSVARIDEKTGSNTPTEVANPVETWTETRTPLVRTPHGRWRPPTNYSRSGESGYVKTYDGHCQLRYLDTNVPPHPTRKVGGGGKNASGSYFTTLPPLPSNFESRAIIKARLKLKSQNVNLAQAYAERGQTVRLVAENLGRLYRMVKDVKRLKLPKKEDFFNHWLELQYGWKPLLSDCYGAMDALTKDSDANKSMVTVKATIKSEDYFEKVLSDTIGAQCSVVKSHRVEHKAFIRLDFIPTDLPTSTLTQLGLTNPLSIAWELLPWSFVADWFIPIGDYLSSLDATAGWIFKGGSFSSKTTMKTKALSVSYEQSDNPGLLGLSGSITVEGEGRQYRFNRKAYSSAPLPTLPSLAKLDKSSPMHVANGIALLMSAIIGGNKVR